MNINEMLCPDNLKTWKEVKEDTIRDIKVTRWDIAAFVFLLFVGWMHAFTRGAIWEHDYRNGIIIIIGVYFSMFVGKVVGKMFNME